MNSDLSQLSKPPRDVHVLFKYLLGLPSDASQQEIENEWANTCVPLINRGPLHLFDREALQLMAGGLTGDQARRVFKQTRRGQQLWNSADREGKIRASKAAATPPFLKKGKL
jgi:hypothetical protein